MPGLRTIGVLGGMGPEATIALMARVVAAVQARDDADHIPLIVDQNTQVPSRIAALIGGGGKDPAPTLVAMAKRLQMAGAAALAMPCNTAHSYADQIVEATDIPLINMVELAVGAMEGQACTGILCSPALRQAGVFEPSLSRTGSAPVYCADDHQMLSLVRRIKREGVDDAARSGLREASNELLARGAQVQILACTEFSLMPDALAEGVRGIDPLDLLARAVVAFSRSGEAEAGA